MSKKNPFQEVIDHHLVMNTQIKHALILSILLIEIGKAFKKPTGYQIKRINWLFEKANEAENL